MRLLALLAFAIPTATAAAPALTDQVITAFDSNTALGLSPAPGHYAVRVAPDVELSDLEGRVSGCAPTHRWGQSLWVSIECDSGMAPRPTLAAWANQPGVTWAQASFPAELHRAPDDLTPEQWHHSNTGQRIGSSTGVAGADIGSLDAWERTTGTGAPVVAVIDTGVFWAHNELVDRIYQPPGEVCDNGLDDDGNGYIDDCRGWDVGDDDNDPDPRNLPAQMSSGAPCAPFHGTFIAGLVSGTADNNAGVSGILWDGQVMPIKMVSDDRCRLTDSQLAEAITYAVGLEAPIITASWAFTGTSQALEDAFSGADEAGTILAISAGNRNSNVDDVTSYPIDYQVKNAIVVASTDNKDTRASFSNWGAEKVDLAAPGANLRSLAITGVDATQNSSGTSFSSPLVAGAAALIWDAYPMLRGSEVKASILDGATPIDGLNCGNTDKCVRTGARLHLPGALDAAAYWAVTAFPEGRVLIIDEGDGDGVIERGESGQIRVQVVNQGHGTSGALSATLVVQHPLIGGGKSLDFPAIPGDGSVDSTDGLSFSVPLSCEGQDEAHITIDVADPSIPEIWTFTYRVPVLCDVDEDEDGSRYPDDCDDLDPSIRPDADELCNDVDDDCDGDVDNDPTDGLDFWVDSDGDGWGGAVGDEFCTAPDGYTNRPGDCDDADANAFPGTGGYDEQCQRTCGCTQTPLTPTAPLGLALLALVTLRGRSRRRICTSAGPSDRLR
ncbi:MAG: S8 family serine peptidase [Myxococcota bacterium]